MTFIYFVPSPHDDVHGLLFHAALALMLWHFQAVPFAILTEQLLRQRSGGSWVRLWSPAHAFHMHLRTCPTLGVPPRSDIDDAMTVAYPTRPVAPTALLRNCFTCIRNTSTPLSKICGLRTGLAGDRALMPRMSACFAGSHWLSGSAARLEHEE